MPRPTPARILYLIVGLVLGLAVAVWVQSFLLPGIRDALPFGTSSAPPAPPLSGPTQFAGQNIERVAALNLAQEHGGVTLRLNALELYGDGFTLTYAVTSGRGGVSPQTLEPETFQVTDERGTPYTLSPLATGAVLSAGFTTGLATFTPAPPPEVRQVRLVVPNVVAVGFRLREGQSRVTAGPWTFDVAVRG